MLGVYRVHEVKNRKRKQGWICWYSPITINIVVEREFLVFPNQPLCEDSHPHSVAYSPFGDIAVGTTAVVRESADATALRRINELFERNGSD